MFRWTIRPSYIEGLGLHALTFFPKNTIFGITHVKDDRFQHDWIRTPLGGFYNHSDKPNCRCAKVGDVRILKSIKKINPGDELTVAYTLYDPED